MIYQHFQTKTISIYNNLFLNTIKGMSLFDKIKNAFKFLDQFSHSEFVNYKHSSEYNTVCGGHVSIILFIIFAILAVYQVLKILRIDSVVASTVVSNENNPSLSQFKLNDGSANMFAITFKDDSGISYRKYFDVQAYQVSAGSSNSTPVKFVPCTSGKFSYKLDPHQKVNNIAQAASRTNIVDNGLCPPDNFTFNVSGRENQDSYNILRLKVKKCSNRSQCVDATTFSNLLSDSSKLIRFGIPFINTVITPGFKDYKNIYLQDRNYYYMDNKRYPQIEARIADFTANVDRTILPITWKNTQNTIGIPSPLIFKDMPIQSTNPVYFQVKIIKSADKYIFYQTFTKVDTAISYIGSLIGLVMGSVLIVLSGYSSKSYFISIAEKIYSYKDQKIPSEFFNFLHHINLSVSNIKESILKKDEKEQDQEEKREKYKKAKTEEMNKLQEQLNKLNEQFGNQNDQEQKKKKQQEIDVKKKQITAIQNELNKIQEQQDRKKEEEFKRLQQELKKKKQEQNRILYQEERRRKQLELLEQTNQENNMNESRISDHSKQSKIHDEQKIKQDEHIKVQQKFKVSSQQMLQQVSLQLIIRKINLLYDGFRAILSPEQYSTLLLRKKTTLEQSRRFRAEVQIGAELEQHQTEQDSTEQCKCHIDKHRQEQKAKQGEERQNQDNYKIDKPKTENQEQIAQEVRESHEEIEESEQTQLKHKCHKGKQAIKRIMLRSVQSVLQSSILKDDLISWRIVNSLKPKIFNKEQIRNAINSLKKRKNQIAERARQMERSKKQEKEKELENKLILENNQKIQKEKDDKDK